VVGAPGKGLGGEAFVYQPVDQLGAWVALGGASAGSGGLEPALEGTGSLQAGAPTQLVLSDGAPLAPALLVAGLSVLGQPFQGGVLHPQPDVLLPLVLDEQGREVLAWPWPAGVAPATSLTFQGWVADPGAAGGWAGSNGVAAYAP